jgi:hypothetical protein
MNLAKEVRNRCFPSVLLYPSSHRWIPQTIKVAATGLEIPSAFNGKTAIPKTGGAKSGALLAISDPELALLIDRWPTLPAATKTTILAVVREDKGTE